MEYRIIQGLRADSHLLHVPSEDMLYVLKNKRGGRKEYICYQTILTAPKKGSTDVSSPKCSARVRIIADGICERMSVNHTCHQNHGIIRRDMEKLMNMKERSRYLRDNFADSSHRIPTRHIFQREIIK